MATQTIECSAQCEVVVQLAPAPPQTENLTDIGQVFILFLSAVAVVFMARQLLNLFIAPDEK
jgi:Fe2+ transport system protein B